MTTDRIQCPVCRYTHIPGDMDTCPQCDSDLTCFRLLDGLSDKPPEPAPVSVEAATRDRSAFGDISDGRETAAVKSHDLSGSHPRRIPLALMALTLVLAGFFIFFTYRLSTVENLMQRQHTALMDLVTSDSSLENDPPGMDRVLEPIRKQDISLGEMNPMPDRKKRTPGAIQPILIISEALETDSGTKVLGIIME